MHIRHALPEDLEAILEIYNDAVISTVAIWNEQTVDLENRREWFIQHQDQGYPILVAVDDDDVVGYATFGDWRTWRATAIRWNTLSMFEQTSAAEVPDGCS